MNIWNWLFTARDLIDGNGAVSGNHTADPSIPAKNETTATSPGKAGGGPIMRMQIDLYQHGRDRAIASGALQSRESDIRSLKEHAEAMARETRRGLYDPKNKEQDRLRDIEHKKLIADRAEAE